MLRSLFRQIVIISISGAFLIVFGWLLMNHVPYGVSMRSVGAQEVLLEEAATISAVKSVKPAVVSIVVSKDIAIQGQQQIYIDPFSSQPYRIVQLPNEKRHEQIGAGTGFVIKNNGYILTNKHVVSDASADYTVLLNDGRTFPAKVLGRHPSVDLAILKIEAADLPTVRLGDSDALETGQTVMAIGNSLGKYQNTVTKGVVSSIGRSVVAGDQQGGSETLSDIIQTDAAINPGNSGGPLVNLKGEVVGINSAVDQEGQGIGFAIPINESKPFVENAFDNGKIEIAWLGVRYVLITPEIQKKNKLPQDYGAFVVSDNITSAVIDGSPAQQGGIQPKDVILEIDGAKITKSNPLYRIVSRHRPGDTLVMKVWRGGVVHTLKVTLKQAP